MQITKRRAFQAEGAAGAKALRQQHAWHVLGAMRETVWPEWYE